MNVQSIIERIGKEYVEDYPVVPDDPDVAVKTETAFEIMGDVNRELFGDIPMGVIFQEEDPYDDYQDMKETVDEENFLRVFDGGDPHPFWDHETEVISRAVHDWHGHLTLDVDFSPVGEYVKWRENKSHYPPFCHRVFFTEVVGQVGAVHYLDDGFADERFEQKVFPAPPDWIEQLSYAVRCETEYDG